MKKILVVIIALVILGGGGAYLALHKSNNTKTNNSKTDTSAMDMPQKQTSDSTATPTATNTVTIDNFAFSPTSITVKKGTTVTWTNKDSATHTITETDSQDGPKSEDLTTGQSYSFTFNTSGTFHYDCSIHTSMTGMVTVTE
jgi:plastocyanin